MINGCIIINNRNYQLIPYGYCACGCGQKTNLAKKTNNKLKLRKGKPCRFLHNHQMRLLKMERNHMWTGGRHKDSDGYMIIKNDQHPRSCPNGYVKEHILIAEKAFGRALPPGAVVHHVNGTKDSGDLVVCEDNAYHKLLHQRSRAYKACGHSSWRKCRYCKSWDDPINMWTSSKTKEAYHRSCHNLHNQMLRRLGVAISPV